MSVRDVGDGHQLDIWVKYLAVVLVLVGEASVNVLDCDSCQHPENRHQNARSYGRGHQGQYRLQHCLAWLGTARRRISENTEGGRAR